jgi:hypothetical protein
MAVTLRSRGCPSQPILANRNERPTASSAGGTARRNKALGFSADDDMLVKVHPWVTAKFLASSCYVRPS